MTSPGGRARSCPEDAQTERPLGSSCESPWLCLCSGRCPQASHLTLGHHGHWSGIVTHLVS